MPRLLKRDYNTSELLEIATQMVARLTEEYKVCYTTVEKTKNRIEIAYNRQLVRYFTNKLRQEETTSQGGLFSV